MVQNSDQYSIAYYSKCVSCSISITATALGVSDPDKFRVGQTVEGLLLKSCSSCGSDLFTRVVGITLLPFTVEYSSDEDILAEYSDPNGIGVDPQEDNDITAFISEEFLEKNREKSDV